MIQNGWQQIIDGICTNYLESQKQLHPYCNGKIVIAGPTASGKSALAIQLAHTLQQITNLQCVIINADAIQMYQGLPILSAQPILKDGYAYDILHMLYNFASPTNISLSVADWLKMVHGCFNDYRRNQCINIVVGGSSMYIKSLVEGISPIPEIMPEVRQHVRAILLHYGPKMIYHYLQASNIDIPAHVTQRDTYRIQRIYETWLSSGRAMVDLWKSEVKTNHHNYFKILLEPSKEQLLHNIYNRTALMINDTLFQEVIQFQKKYNLSKSNTIGFQYICDHLSNRINRDTMQSLIYLETKKYAKRQNTFFKKLSWDLRVNSVYHS